MNKTIWAGTCCHLLNASDWPIHWPIHWPINRVRDCFIPGMVSLDHVHLYAIPGQYWHSPRIICCHLPHLYASNSVKIAHQSLETILSQHCHRSSNIFDCRRPFAKCILQWTYRPTTNNLSKAQNYCSTERQSNLTNGLCTIKASDTEFVFHHHRKLLW